MPVNMRWSAQVFLAIKGSCALIVMAVGMINPVQAPATADPAVRGRSELAKAAPA